MPRVYKRKTNRGNEPKEIMEAAATYVKNGKSLSLLPNHLTFPETP